MKIHTVHMADPKPLVITTEASPGTMIVVELTERDRQNIADMVPGATLYSMFDDSEDRDRMVDLLDELKHGGPPVDRPDDTEATT